MEQFRRFLESDGIIIDPIQKSDDSLIIRPKIPSQDQINYTMRQKQFSNEIIVKVVLDPHINIELDLSPQVEILSSESKSNSNKKSKHAPANHCRISTDYFQLFNWDQIYFALLDYREQKNWYNLVFTKYDLQQIIEQNSFYTLICHPEYIAPKSMRDLQILQDIVIKLLKKYLNVFYQQEKQKWIQKN